MTEVHRIESTVGETPVNAYLIEGEDQLVAVDGTLTVSGGRSIAERIEALGKPLAAVVVTHAHPDHYGGVVEFAGGPDASILATKGVDSVIRRDDEIKEEILRPMFDQEWPAERAFPTRIVDGGSELSFGDIELTVQDLGPGESPHDSIWFLGEGRGEVFSGDQGYNHMHGYLADGYWEEWLANIEQLRRELSIDAVLHVGHGDPAGTEVLDWERSYIERFLEAVRGADWEDTETAKTAVRDAMGAFLENQDLRFLMELSIEPVAAKLGLTAGRAGEGGRQ
jgi:glyoxylase-like metal-dependent hydrolase (beta-lactamase superfamily II)